MTNAIGWVDHVSPLTGLLVACRIGPTASAVGYDVAPLTRLVLGITARQAHDERFKGFGL